MDIYYSWKTKKLTGEFEGFEALVIRNVKRDTANEAGLYVDSNIIMRKRCATRARAASFAKKWKMRLTKGPAVASSTND